MTTPTDNLAVLLAELEQILEEERAILLSGNPQRITGVVQRKLVLAERIERLCEVPGTEPPSIDALMRLARYNRENSVICSAILRHLTKTIDKLRRHELHRSYGPDGTEHHPPAQYPLGAA
jgi:flagellar biosynthesis/type III secretory pathway chaperone